VCPAENASSHAPNKNLQWVPTSCTAADLIVEHQDKLSEWHEVEGFISRLQSEPLPEIATCPWWRLHLAEYQGNTVVNIETLILCIVLLIVVFIRHSFDGITLLVMVWQWGSYGHRYVMMVNTLNLGVGLFVFLMHYQRSFLQSTTNGTQCGGLAETGHMGVAVRMVGICALDMVVRIVSSSASCVLLDRIKCIATFGLQS
jgi:hypothetical protein